MRRTAFLVLILCLCISGTAYALPPKVIVNKQAEAILKQIRKFNSYESAFVGFAGSASEQRKRGVSLIKKASAKELAYVAQYDKNGVARLYAYEALKEKDAAKAKQLLPIMQRDTVKINTLIGCMGGKKAINELLNEEE